jgi:hypothetical protein
MKHRKIKNETVTPLYQMDPSTRVKLLTAVAAVGLLSQPATAMVLDKMEEHSTGDSQPVSIEQRAEYDKAASEIASMYNQCDITAISRIPSESDGYNLVNVTLEVDRNPEAEKYINQYRNDDHVIWTQPLLITSTGDAEPQAHQIHDEGVMGSGGDMALQAHDSITVTMSPDDLGAAKADGTEVIFSVSTNASASYPGGKQFGREFACVSKAIWHADTSTWEITAF